MSLRSKYKWDIRSELDFNFVLKHGIVGGRPLNFWESKSTGTKQIKVKTLKMHLHMTLKVYFTTTVCTKGF